MALVLADRVRETTTVVGTGTATLLGAIASYQSFAAIGNANTVYYTIVDQSTGAWEVGIGTYTASGTTLSRDTVLSSSNGGSLVNFAAGTKDVWGDYPAGKAVTTDTLAYPPAIGGTTPNAGTFTTLTATGQTSLGGAAGSEGLRVVPVASSTRFLTAQGSAADEVYLTASGPSGSNVALALSSRATGAVRFYTNTANQEQMRVAHTASAVNYVQVTGAATGAPSQPIISAQGSDANINIALQGKGTGAAVLLDAGGGATLRAIPRATGGDTWLDVQRSVAGVALSAASGVTNGAMIFQSKGTGAINLAPGSSGVNISNGGTVTAITTTANGTSYTTLPSITISAPTTAGGVQATASIASMFTSSATVVSGGTGYTVGDVVTLVGGTVSSGGVVGRYTVTAVSGGAITALTRTQGNYVVLPTNPVSVTGGTGTGATFTVVYSFQSASITNAGSGYVEQPTVTFSGGGGSGAAAYATVGSGTVVKSLGTTLDFYTPNSSSVPAFRISDIGGGDSFYRSYAPAGGVNLVAQGNTNANANLGSNGTGSIFLTTNGTSLTTQLRVTHTASAVNFVQVTGAATGGRPTISAQGSDAAVDLNFAAKGIGGIYFQQFSVFGSGKFNNWTADGAVTGLSPFLRAGGGDTNVSATFGAKGTGAINLAPGSSGVNISNGGTVTAITRTANGSGYTSFPSVAISAPTTAGGVQATASANLFANTATVASGGTGYTNGNVLTVVGGTGGPATYTVTGVSAGAVTSVTPLNFGSYSVLPTNPVSVTGGSGSSATLNLTYGISTPSITNAGSGYVEQPTVTFSGGGGSGAAAYATVGSGVTLKSLGPTLDVYVNNSSGRAFQFYNSGGADSSYWSAASGSSSPFLYATGAANTTGRITSNGTGSILIYTNGGAQQQFAVTHTASAVNFVQVTGGATGAAPTISSQGSDTNIPLTLVSKGNNGIVFQTRGGGTPRISLQLSDSGSASVNFFQMQSNIAGASPNISVLGADTNIDLALTPKGEGNVVARTGQIYQNNLSMLGMSLIMA